MNLTALPPRYFGTHRQCFTAASLTWRHTTTVRNVNIALYQNIALLLHPHVDVPYSVVVK